MFILLLLLCVRLSNPPLFKFKLTDGELFNSPMGFSYKYSVVNLTMSLVIDLKFIEVKLLWLCASYDLSFYRT